MTVPLHDIIVAYSCCPKPDVSPIVGPEAAETAASMADLCRYYCAANAYRSMVDHGLGYEAWLTCWLLRLTEPLSRGLWPIKEKFGPPAPEPVT